MALLREKNRCQSLASMEDLGRPMHCVLAIGGYARGEESPRAVDGRVPERWQIHGALVRIENHNPWP